MLVLRGCLWHGNIICLPTFCSNWAEAGENTFMREPLTWEVFNQASGSMWQC